MLWYMKVTRLHGHWLGNMSFTQRMGWSPIVWCLGYILWLVNAWQFLSAEIWVVLHHRLVFDSCQVALWITRILCLLHKAQGWRICIPSLGACLKSKQWTSDFFWLYVSPFSYLRVNSLFFWVCVTKNMPLYGCKLILVVAFSFRFAGMDKISLGSCFFKPLPLCFLPPPLCLPISGGEGFPSCKWCATSLKF